jgi:protein translocase SecG subunit
MINLFLIVSAIIGAILILIILFQKTEGGSLGLGTQTSLTGGMTSNKSSFSGMTKITYALGFGFLFWCLFMGAIYAGKRWTCYPKQPFEYSQVPSKVLIVWHLLVAQIP